MRKPRGPVSPPKTPDTLDHPGAQVAAALWIIATVGYYLREQLARLFP